LERIELQGKALYAGGEVSEAYFVGFFVEGWELKKAHEFQELLDAFALGEDGMEAEAEEAEEAFYASTGWQPVLVLTSDHKPACLVGKKL
jgi:hypothetical protein